MNPSTIKKSAARIVVVGAESQLGKILKTLRPEWQYISSRELDLQNLTSIQSFFSEKPYLIINFAAFTAVDLAEKEKDKALTINAHAVRELARSCENLIHISTDYVFSGEASRPYEETDAVAPVNYYGVTKLTGEQSALAVQPRTYIIRTSWLYSEHNMNFVKRMIELGRTRDSLKVVHDQRGCPTLALDLVQVVVRMAEELQNISPGVYHYSNEGECSWYEFTKEIFRLNGINTPVTPITTAEYPTPAKRPKYSVMSKNKIKKTLNLQVPDWQTSLAQFLKAHLQS